MVLRCTTSNERVELNFSPVGASTGNNEESGEVASENTVLMEVLFLLETFDVSDAFYHELSMILPQLPRSYKVKRMRSDISSSIDIIRLPEPVFGAYRPVTRYLQALIGDQVCYYISYMYLLSRIVWRGSPVHCLCEIQW